MYAAMRWAAASLFLFLSTGALAQDLARFDPAHGVGGFLGDVKPLDRPFVIQWGPRSGIVGAVETLTTHPDGQSETIVTVFTGTITELRGGFQRRFAVSELTVNERHIAAREPLVVVESWADPRGGNVSELRIAFPGMTSIGLPVPRAGSPEYRLWQDMFAADLAYAAGPVAAGDSIFDQEGYKKLIEDQVRTILGDDDADIVRNTYLTKARGLTTVNGHPHLVAELSGEIEARAGASTLLMKGAGYGLIDLASGVSSGISRTEVIARRGGRDARRTVVVGVNLIQ
jgi:hypothetical protein